MNFKRKTINLILIILSLLFLLNPIKATNENLVYALYDEVKDEILLGEKVDKIHAIASISKLMVAEIVFDKLEKNEIKKEDELTFSADEKKLYGSDVPLRIGQKITLEEALNLLLVRSANSSALLLAKHIANNEADFVKMMNDKAKEIGMTNTNFINSHGLPIIKTDEQNTSTVNDLILLVKHLIKNYPKILDYTKQKEYKIDRYVLTVTNTNPMLFEKGYFMVDGLKTGTTDKAGKCLITTASQNCINTSEKDLKRRIFTFVLGAKTDGERLEKTKSLLDLGLNTFIYKEVLNKNREYIVPLNKINYNEEKVTAIPENSIRYVLDTRKNYKLKRTFFTNMEDDIKLGTKLGEISLLEDGKIVKKISLVAKEEVEKSGFIKRTWKKFLKIIK